MYLYNAYWKIIFVMDDKLKYKLLNIFSQILQRKDLEIFFIFPFFLSLIIKMYKLCCRKLVIKFKKL